MKILLKNFSNLRVFPTQKVQISISQRYAMLCVSKGDKKRVKMQKTKGITKRKMRKMQLAFCNHLAHFRKNRRKPLDLLNLLTAET